MINSYVIQHKPDTRAIDESLYLPCPSKECRRKGKTNKGLKKYLLEKHPERWQDLYWSWKVQKRKKKHTNNQTLHSKTPHVVTVLWLDSDDVVTILSPTRNLVDTQWLCVTGT